MHSLPSKRSRDAPAEIPEVKKPCTPNVQNSSTGSVPNLHTSVEAENPPIPDDLSEISDDADEILNRDDVSILCEINYYFLSKLIYVTAFWNWVLTLGLTLWRWGDALRNYWCSIWQTNVLLFYTFRLIWCRNCLK